MILTDHENDEWLTDPKNALLFETAVSYLEARRGGKRGTYDEHKFEVWEWENIVRLRDAIYSKTYKPSRGTAHIIHNPVMREIFAACFPDRSVHHWIYNSIYDWWDRRFIYDSYSCREGKGTLFGINRLAHHINSVADNGKARPWVIKMDIQGYFMSLPREKLYRRAIDGLDKQFAGNYGMKYDLLKYCLYQTIFDDPCQGVKRKGWPEDWVGLPDSKSLFKQPPGVGIVIGNLTSQLLSNVYLNQLDRYVMYTLGFKHYGRYVDDFYIVVPEGPELERAIASIPLIRDFLKRDGLTLHPKKIYIQPAERGVDFVGATVRPGRIYPGKRLIRNANAAFDEVLEGTKGVETVVSYIGHMKHMRSKKLLREMFESRRLDDMIKYMQ